MHLHCPLNQYSGPVCVVLQHLLHMLHWVLVAHKLLKVCDSLCIFWQNFKLHRNKRNTSEGCFTRVDHHWTITQTSTFRGSPLGVFLVRALNFASFPPHIPSKNVRPIESEYYIYIYTYFEVLGAFSWSSSFYYLMIAFSFDYWCIC